MKLCYINKVPASHFTGINNAERKNHTVLTYRYRINPTQDQEVWLFHAMEHLRELHNSARLNRVRAYEEEVSLFPTKNRLKWGWVDSDVEGTSRFVSYQEQTKILTEARKRHSDFKEIPQDFQNHALRRVDKASANFRRRLKQGSDEPGFPRYRKRIHSLTWSLRKRKDKHGDRVGKNPILGYQPLRNEKLPSEGRSTWNKILLQIIESEMSLTI